MAIKDIKSIWWVIIPLILGMIVSAPGFDEFLKSRHLGEMGMLTEGEVVGIDKLRKKSGGQPIVIFTHNNGQPVKKVFDDPVGGLYKIGEIVPVVYDPENPLLAKIKTHYGMYSLVYIPFFLAAFSYLFSMWFFIQRVYAIRRMRKQIDEVGI